MPPTTELSSSISAVLNTLYCAEVEKDCYTGLNMAPPQGVTAFLLLLVSAALLETTDAQTQGPNFPRLPTFKPPQVPIFKPPPVPTFWPAPNLPPFKPPVQPTKAMCTNPTYRYCYQVPIHCPWNCPRSCAINCITCSPVCKCNKPGGICQDPRFIGGDGITFYFHGKKDRDFCLLSDSDLHINAHFIGRRGANRTRDFTWVQAVGILFGDHRLYVGAQKTAAWDNSVDRLSITFDGEPVTLAPEEGAMWRSHSTPAVSIIRSAGANAVTVEVENMFKVTADVVPITEEESRAHGYGITADDCFAHLELGFKFFDLTSDVHGVLGQTYRDDYVSRVKMSSNMPLMGGEPKYAVPSLFSTDCEVKRFGNGGKKGAGIAMATEKPVLSCESGMRGSHGIVCKK
ncbi:hypothetical protein Taro_009210 [Colocasia esculenta]|uniref:Root cap n=1 Tax=Colocasia esculenta TaxID=4460 RepID=A0A843U537_COLES|nr:hypothetical protein [Colocasia esculenta]